MNSAMSVLLNIMNEILINGIKRTLGITSCATRSCLKLRLENSCCL